MELTKSNIITSVYNEDRGEWGIEEEAYGYCVYDSHPLAIVYEGELSLGNRKISEYSADLLQGKIPVWYCLREWSVSMEYWSFVCGMDLLKNGKVWVGINDSTFDTIEEAIAFVENEKGTICKVFMEDEMKF
jgi:hypothetical protein